MKDFEKPEDTEKSAAWGFFNGFVKMENIEKDIDDLIVAYGRLNYFVLAQFVKRLESTEVGQAVVQKNPDRRLYAILTPTKDEYLQRLEALVKLTDGQEGELLRSELRTMLPAIKFNWCIMQHYFSGQITSIAAFDLQNKLWGISPLDEPAEDILG